MQLVHAGFFTDVSVPTLTAVLDLKSRAQCCSFILHHVVQIRHDIEGDNDDKCTQLQGIVSKWRQKERLKTTAVALVLCLNIGVDPPDVIKISPCARLECWVDPLSMQPPKALDTIGQLRMDAHMILQ